MAAKKGASPAAPGSDAAAATTSEPVQTTETAGVIVFPRGVQELPPETKEIQPHPKGIELGILIQMLKDYEVSDKGGTLYNFLQEKFCRVSGPTASEFCDAISTKASKVTSRTKVSDLEPPQAEALYKVFQEAKLAPPPTDCLAPIGVRQLLAGLLKGVRAEFYAASSREAEVYRGRPFQIEAAIAFGGELPGDESARVIRFANRVPLLFQQSACSSFKSVTETNWRNYDLQQPRESLPVGPLVIMIHMASVWVPFTSESKEAIADYDEIRKEMKLALMECGRKLGTYLKKRAKMKREGERRDVFQKYIGEIAKACNAITGADAKKLYDALLEQAKKKTAIADLELDEDGKKIKAEDPADQEGVIVVEQAVDQKANASAIAALASKAASNPFAVSKSEAAKLKVASMRDDDEPTLIDTKAAKRLGPKGEAAKPAAKDPVKAPAKPAAAPAAPAPAAAPAKAGKPRMRLDPKTGKMVPVDEPGLF
jgi:DNA topoisomerase-6 subunit B